MVPKVTFLTSVSYIGYKYVYVTVKSPISHHNQAILVDTWPPLPLSALW